MGESKRRKASDPHYGRAPKHGRGLVVSPPLSVEGPSLHIRQSWLDPQELRIALLLWDRLAWPQSQEVHVASGPDEQFLEQEGILIRPSYRFGGDAAQAVAQAQIQAFRDLEQREPGAWALAQGENSFLLRDRVLEEDRGALVELNRAIPAPDKDVPLNDILEFKFHRRDELLRLRIEIESFFTAINNATDKHFELRRYITQIDAACADLLKVGRESTFIFRLTDLKSSFELRPFAAFAAGAGGWQWGTAHEMPMAAAALGVALSSLKISKDFGLRGTKLRSSPYRYVYLFHEEVF